MAVEAAEASASFALAGALAGDMAWASSLFEIVIGEDNLCVLVLSLQL